MLRAVLCQAVSGNFLMVEVCLLVLELSLALLTLMLNSGISLTSAEKGPQSSPTCVSSKAAWFIKQVAKADHVLLPLPDHSVK